MIRNIGAIAERELRSYFVSPIAWVITAVFIALWGFLFSGIISGSRQADLRPLLSNFSVTFIFMGPFLTMRLIAEEARTGTLELMLTQPVREVELVIGKFLGALLLLLFMLAVTLVFPAILMQFGNPDRGPILSGYIGVMLQGAAFLAIGLMISALTQNQIVAAAVTFVILLTLWLSDLLTQQIPGPVGQIAQYISITQRFQDLPKGVISSRDVVFFLSVILACLFVSTQIIAARRWR
jgi:ABC-2 type transport system permease protein